MGCMRGEERVNVHGILQHEEMTNTLLNEGFHHSCLGQMSFGSGIEHKIRPYFYHSHLLKGSVM